MKIRPILIVVAVLAGICVVGWCASVFSQTVESETDQPPCIHELVYESAFGVSLIEVEVAGSQPLTFLVDTGATQSAFNDTLMAESIGLEAASSGLARGLGAGAKPIVITNEAAVSHRGVELLRTDFAIHDIGPMLMRRSGRSIDGIIGYALFNRYVVEFEPLSGRLRLHDPETFSYDGDGWVLPMEIEDKRPTIEARVVVSGDRVIPVKLMVDTGSSRALSLLIGSKRRLNPPADTITSSGIGVTGEVAVQIGRIERLEISTITLSQAETAWVEPYRISAARNIEDLNGILGNRFLSMFRVFFDYNKGQLILERPRPIRAILPQ